LPATRAAGWRLGWGRGQTIEKDNLNRQTGESLIPTDRLEQIMAVRQLTPEDPRAMMPSPAAAPAAHHFLRNTFGSKPSGNAPPTPSTPNYYGNSAQVPYSSSSTSFSSGNSSEAVVVVNNHHYHHHPHAPAAAPPPPTLTGSGIPVFESDSDSRMPTSQYMDY